MADPSSIIQGAPEEQDTVESKFTLEEMYSVIPCHIRNELFDHLDLRQASRLSRVSTSWASELRQIPKRTKGTTVLEDFLRAGRMEKLRKFHEETEDQAYLFEWLPVFLALPKSIDVTHLILVDQARPHCRNIWDMGDHDKDKEWFLRVIPPLKKITFSTLYQDTLEEIRNLWSLFDQTEKHSCCENSGNETWGGGYLCWSLEVQCIDIRLTKGTCNYDHSDDLKWIWRLLDSKHAIWPYPEAQLQWLLKSLNDLEGEVLQTVKYLDEKWRAQSEVDSPELWDTLDKYDFTIWEEQKLTSLDLGFLGRLLVKIDQYQKIPGLVAPPYAFPDDLCFSCS